MNTEFIKKNLSKEIHQELVEDLVTYYTQIKNEFYLQKHGPMLINSGKFCETVFQILEYLVSGQVIGNPNFTKIAEKLENLPSSRFPVSIRLLIPRITKTIYDIRSKRGAAHKKDISPNQMDCDIVVAQCDWILSEFLRLYHDSNVEEIKQIIKEIFKRKIPLVEQFDEDVLVLDEELSVKNQILTILWHFYPKPVLVEDLKRWVVYKRVQNIYASISNAVSKRLLFRRKNQIHLTENGLRYIEELFKKK